MSRSTRQSTPQNQQPNTSLVEDTTLLGIDPDSEFAAEVPVYNHDRPHEIRDRLKQYNENDSNNLTLGDLKHKAVTAFEIIQKSQAVLVEAEPWLISRHMETDQFDRWEPFFVAFPEIASEHMKFTNLAPLSEIAYRLNERNEFLQMHKQGKTVEHSDYDPMVHAQMQEQLAFARYELDAVAGLESLEEDDGLWIAPTPIKAIHACLSPWQQHLIIGSRDDGSLYCGRGPLFDRHVDVAIDLDRRINEHGERKVAVYNDKSKKNAMNALDFDKTHARYLGEKARWEVDMAAIETVIRSLLMHDHIEFVSLHRITEKAYVTHVNPEFRQMVEGYPAFDN
jgi:predicted GIY-YIG superfamily endonuclease